MVYTGFAMLKEEAGVVNSELTSEISVEKELKIAVVVAGGNALRAAVDIMEDSLDLNDSVEFSFATMNELDAVKFYVEDTVLLDESRML